MKLTNPRLAKCDDRGVFPKSNQEAGSPEEWFSTNTLSEYNLIGFNYDFFINWSHEPYRVTRVVWVKRILHGKESDKLLETCSREDIVQLLKESETADYLEKFASHCYENKLKLQFLIYRDISWNNNPECIIVAEVSWTRMGMYYSISRIDLEELKNRIRWASGGAITIGRKGLIYGTSMLECYLSGTNSLYPGDADLVLTNNAFENIAILEFKKHNLDSTIRSQKLDNYYPRPDGRKYDRLAILRDYFTKTPKLFTLYYPTKNTEGSVIEYIEGDPGHLVSSERKMLSLPTIGNSNSYTQYVGKIIDFINLF